MQVVGEHLNDYAEKIRGKSPDDDLFARSAFNRYYYATFLASRRLLIDTLGTKRLQHKALPEYLRGDFRRTIQRRIKRGFQSGLLSGTERSQMLTALNDNTALLSQLLVDAYGVRVLADYEPELAVQISDESFSLGGVTLPAASGWVRRANMCCKNLYKVWKDLAN